MLLILVTFIVGLVFLGFVNKAHSAASIPPESLALFNKLTKDLSGTAIPEYVLTYGTTT
jgi:hypothetical protein